MRSPRYLASSHEGQSMQVQQLARGPGLSEFLATNIGPGRDMKRRNINLPDRQPSPLPGARTARRLGACLGHESTLEGGRRGFPTIFSRLEASNTAFW